MRTPRSLSLLLRSVGLAATVTALGAGCYEGPPLAYGGQPAPYVEPGYGGDMVGAPTPMAYDAPAPPPPQFEVRPPMPYDGALWVDGYWDWIGGRWSWYGGRWGAARAGYGYVGPSYRTVGGRVYVTRPYWRPGVVAVGGYGGGVRVSGGGYYGGGGVVRTGYGYGGGVRVAAPAYGGGYGGGVRVGAPAYGAHVYAAPARSVVVAAPARAFRPAYNPAPARVIAAPRRR